VSDKIFVIVYTQIVFFKMHSYLMTNLEYRDILISQQSRLQPLNFKAVMDNNKKLRRYPYNVTLKDYLRYLCIPTVVYEQNFPSTHSFNVLYFGGHLCFSLGNILI
jgi:hypothetical protein